ARPGADQRAIEPDRPAAGRVDHGPCRLAGLRPVLLLAGLGQRQGRRPPDRRSLRRRRHLHAGPGRHRRPFGPPAVGAEGRRMTFDVAGFAVAASWAATGLGSGLWLWSWLGEKHAVRRLRFLDSGVVLLFSSILLR